MYFHVKNHQTESTGSYNIGYFIRTFHELGDSSTAERPTCIQTNNVNSNTLGCTLAVCLQILIKQLLELDFSVNTTSIANVSFWEEKQAKSHKPSKRYWVFFPTHRTAVATFGINIQLKINGIIYWPLFYLLCTLQLKPVLPEELVPFFSSGRHFFFFFFWWP